MADSAKPILFAGGVAGVALLGVAWMFAASSGSNAEREAAARYEAAVARDGDIFKLAAVSEEPATEETAAEQPEEEQPEAAEPETAASGEAESQPAETAAAEAEPEETAETEAPEPEATETAGEQAETPEEPAETAETEEEPPAETEVAAANVEEPAEEEPAQEEPAEESAVVASVGGDAEKGAKVFRKCKACHQVGEGAENKVGPQLNGILGRVVGGLEDFSYSKAFQEAKAGGEVWDAESLAEFLAAPRKVMKGTKMAFAGLRKEDDRTDVIAYLARGE